MEGRHAPSRPCQGWRERTTWTEPHLNDPPVSTTELLRRALGARAAARLRRAGASLRDIGAAGVAELTATYGLEPKAAQKAEAVLDLARAIHSEPLVRGVAFQGS